MTAAALLLAWAVSDPPAGDAYRLPPVRALTAGRRFNQRYQEHLEHRIGLEPHRDAAVCRALAEARRLYEVWDCAEGAHPDWQCAPDVKAQYLRRLRLLLGPDAYRRMELPPPAPTWLFNELRCP